jgi:hypothetical protein
VKLAWQWLGSKVDEAVPSEDDAGGSGRRGAASGAGSLEPRREPALEGMPLLLVTPGAEALVSGWRAEHDWAAHWGIPAHVTVREPFLPPSEWSEETTESALTLLLPQRVTLARLEDRPGALVIVVEPDDELRRMTQAVSRVWPRLPPHKEGWSDFAYHLTLVRTIDDSVRAVASAEIEPQLPLEVEGTELWAADGSPERGATHIVLARSQGS